MAFRRLAAGITWRRVAKEGGERQKRATSGNGGWRSCGGVGLVYPY
jgi:hypothetical protein